MNEIVNYKYLFFKKMYTDLGLSKVEKVMKQSGIENLKLMYGNYDAISNYFILVNDVDISKLNDTQLQDFHNYFSKDVNQLTNEELEQIYKFMEETYKLLLLPTEKGSHTYYGPINDNYCCPSDSIVIGLCYDILNSKGVEGFELYNKIMQLIGYIHTELAKNFNKKFMILSYNQFVLNCKGQKQFNK